LFFERAKLSLPTAGQQMSKISRIRTKKAATPKTATFERPYPRTTMNLKPFCARYPDFGRVASPEAFCDDAKNDFPDFLAAGIFQQQPRAAFYIHQIEAKDRTHTGLVGLNAVRDFFEGKIKKHEKTLRERERQQAELMLRWKAVLKPVLLSYPPVAAIQHWLENFARAHTPLFEVWFERESQRHRVWAVANEPDTRHLQSLFAQHVHNTYIADGHHRTTTLAYLHAEHRAQYPAFDFDHLFCAYFATDQLDILDYNRVVDLPEGLENEVFTKKIGYVAELRPLAQPRRPQAKHEIVLFAHGQWHTLRWKPELLARHAPYLPTLDAALLNEWVLRDLLGIADARTDTRITYVDGSKGLEGLQKAVLAKNTPRAGFALYPVAFGDLARMADAGEVLPPKSTYFEPRLRSGMLVQML
jgi:uncharacterized protein (DUF1015 family)